MLSYSLEYVPGHVLQVLNMSQNMLSCSVLAAVGDKVRIERPRLHSPYNMNERAPSCCTLPPPPPPHQPTKQGERGGLSPSPAVRFLLAV